MAVKTGSKYHPLYMYLERVEEEQVVLTFEEIERVIGASLPPSARSNRAFWSNRTGGSQASAWMEAGFHVVSLDLQEGLVTFGRPVIRYDVRREEGDVVWNAQMVRALRAHLDMSQVDFAELIAIRQQTVSEWETGVYSPTRASSRLLNMVAERVDFPFDVEEKRIHLKSKES
jgi:DNA-binding XRE family transcriptional regulator